MVRTTPETLTLARRRAQPRAAYIARLTLTAVFAYLLALQFAGNKGPVLAPLTALLVIQVSLTHTLRSAARRVISVVTGVLVAIGLSVVVGFTWWSLGLVIAAALVVGLILRLGDDLLEVPISAMLILSAVGSRSAASGRIVETLIGAGAGLAGGLLFAPVRLQPAEEAIDDLSDRLAGLLRQTAADIADGADPGRSAERLAQARRPGPAGPPTWSAPDWSMRGELLMLLDRLRYELQEEHRARVRESWPARGDARRRRPRWVPRHPGARPRGHDRPGRPVRAADPPADPSAGPAAAPAAGPAASRPRVRPLSRGRTAVVPRARCPGAGLKSLSHHRGGSE